MGRPLLDDSGEEYFFDDDADFDEEAEYEKQIMYAIENQEADDYIEGKGPLPTVEDDLEADFERACEKD